jgi:riboflavin synthase
VFSGVIERQGRLVKRTTQGKTQLMTFQFKAWEKPVKRGESISVNGVCLTVVGHPKANQFSAQVVPETLTQTTLGSIRIRDGVNLERSLKWGERVGGHFVLGHVDGVGRVVVKKPQGKSTQMQIEVPGGILKHLVVKGSIAVDGISLTIQRMSSRNVTIAVVPHTLKNTNLDKKKKGDTVNLEADVIAKHLARLVNPEDAFATLE